MSIYEYDEELHFRTLREEGREEGRAEGLTALNQLYSILIDTDRMEDLKRAIKDKAYQDQLMKELLLEESPIDS